MKPNFLIATSFVVFVCGVVAYGHRSSRGDTAGPTTTSGEPITGTPAVPVTDPQQPPPRDPFTLYDNGPVEGHWSRAQLTPKERVVLDRGLDRPNAAAVHSAFDAAAKDTAAKARAEAAAHQIGADDLATTGVIP